MYSYIKSFHEWLIKEAEFTPSKRIAVGLSIISQVALLMLGVDAIYIFLLALGFLFLLWGVFHKKIDNSLGQRSPSFGKWALRIIIVLAVTWLGWPWSRVQGWFRADTVIVSEAKISPCGASVSALDGRINISWKHLTREVWFNITDFQSNSEPLSAELSRGEAWRFDIGGVDYLLEIIRWPKNKDDTITFNVKLAPSLPELQAIDTSTDLKVIGDTCLSYNVTFLELGIRNYYEPRSDSVLLRFVAHPYPDSQWLIIDTLGTYSLSIRINSAATLRGNLALSMTLVYPKGSSGYTWPQFVSSWTRKRPNHKGRTRGYTRKQIRNLYFKVSSRVCRGSMISTLDVVRSGGPPIGRDSLTLA